MCLLRGLFFLVLLLNQRWFPPLRLQASHCSTLPIMCDVPSIAAFCSEFIECFPGTASKFFLKLLVTIPVAPIITGTIVHFRFHIRCISTPKLLYFNFFSASFCTTFLSAGIATSITVHVYYYYYYYRISHFSASAGKHSPILGYVINRNRLAGFIYNLKSFLQLNMFHELQIFTFLCTYSDAGLVFLDFAVVTLGLLP